jgi:catecholate siderophore receptor
MQHPALRATPLALALSLALIAPAHAAEDPAVPRKPQELDRVEVVGKADDYVVKDSSTATKTPTPIRDTPQSITVVPQQMIRDQAMQNLADVVRYVPGVGMAQGEGNRDTPVFRGNSSTADMFVDGMRDDVQYFRDLYNIDRVEVLKGPNAMIFGRGGSGGVINRVTKQADWETVRELSAQFGSWNKRRVAGDFGQALNERAAFRVTAMYEDSESYRDDYEATRWGVNPTMAFAFGDNTTLTLGYEHFEDERVADRGVPSEPGVFNGTRIPLDTDPSTFFGDPDRSTATADVDAFNALVEHTFASGATLRNRTRIADYDKFYQNVYPGAVNAARTMVAINAYNNATTRRNYFNQTDLVWNATTGGLRHTLLAGAEFGRQETKNRRETGFFGAPGSNATSALVPIALPRYTGPLEFRQSNSDANNESVANVAALYVQDQVEFSPHWQAIVGLRYDRFDVDFTDNRPSTLPANRNISSTDGLWSPRAGLVYKPVEPVSIYASYSVAYQPRSGEQLASLSPTNKAFDPEEFTNYELGAKWDVRPNLALTAAVYRLDRSNVIVPLDAQTSVLVDGQRAEGVEVGLAGSISENWHVMGAYAWQDGEVLAGADRGKRLAQLPKNTFSLWNRFDVTERWGFGVGAQYRGEMFAQLSNAVTLKSFTRYDAAVFFDASEQLSLQLNVENLFDKEYAVSAHTDNNITPGSPRAATVSLRYEF